MQPTLQIDAAGASIILLELATPRLRLRQWRDADRAPFAELNADPVVMQYFPALLDRAASDRAIDAWSAQIAERGWGLWAAEIAASGEFIGFIGLQVPAAELPFSPCVEIGWRLAARYWGRGYATEGATEALRVGFEKLGLVEIVSFTAVGNRRSRAVMERIGMVDSGTTFEHPGVAAGSPLRSHCLYRLAGAQWRTNGA